MEKLEKFNNAQFEHIWTLLDKPEEKGGVPIDITNSLFACKIQKKNGTPAPADFTLSKTGVAGELKGVITAQNMASFSGEYEFEILEKDQALAVYTALRGELVVKQGIVTVAGATWQ